MISTSPCWVFFNDDSYSPCQLIWHLKINGARLLSSWEGLFSGAMLVLGRVLSCFILVLFNQRDVHCKACQEELKTPRWVSC